MQLINPSLKILSLLGKSISIIDLMASLKGMKSEKK
jgi:hypothetical protein